MIKVIKTSQYESIRITLNRINSLVYLFPDFKEVEVIRDYLLDTRIVVSNEDLKENYIQARNTSKTPKQRKKK